mmetsp:Transcript_4729/g.9317  ORF Transcript_4729/g.9317 Transcript_4729/m.9317 type:complete len:155 (+) Transcript_4729:2049-2513(+)
MGLAGPVYTVMLQDSAAMCAGVRDCVGTCPPYLTVGTIYLNFSRCFQDLTPFHGMSVFRGLLVLVFSACYIKPTNTMVGLNFGTSIQSLPLLLLYGCSRNFCNEYALLELSVHYSTIVSKLGYGTTDLVVERKIWRNSTGPRSQGGAQYFQGCN